MKIIFIIGMHRSGTSLLSNCLIENGFSIGLNKNKSKNWQNPNGYFENDSFTILHDKILKYNNSNWSNIKSVKMNYTKEHVSEYKELLKKEFGSTKHLLIKDPRLSFFTDIIKEVCGDNYEYYFLFSTRDRKECCDSLSKAQNITLKKAEEVYDKTHQSFSDEFLKVNHYNTVHKNSETLDEISKFCDFKIINKTNNIVDINLYRNKNDDRKEL